MKLTLITHLIYRNIISTCQYEKLLLYFWYHVFEIWCMIYTYSTSSFGLAAFQALYSCMWLVALVLDSSALHTHIHRKKSQERCQMVDRFFWRIKLEWREREVTFLFYCRPLAFKKVNMYSDFLKHEEFS